MSADLSFLAVDPGNSGAVAFKTAIYNADSRKREVRVGVFKFSEYGYSGTAEKVARIRPDFVVLEKVHSFPGQGVASTWKFAENFGFYIGLFTGMNIPIIYVTPQAWQKHYNFPSKKEVGKDGHKRAMREHAKQIYPKLNPTLETADALLILHYHAKEILKNS
jgi:hypothetical protein